MQKYTWQQIPPLDVPNQVKQYFDFTKKDNCLYIQEKIGYVVKRPEDYIIILSDDCKINKNDAYWLLKLKIEEIINKEKTNEI